MNKLKLKIIQHLYQSSSSKQGFTLVEVLVAILVTTAFILGALQAIVLAAYFKVQAKQYSESTNWILEDLEQVRYWTDAYYPDDYAADGSTHEARCSATTSGSSYAAGLQAYITAKVPVPADKEITSRDFSMTRTLEVYDDTYGATAPYNVLKVSYDVQNTSDSETAAFFQTELVPSSVFDCPLFSN